MSTRRTIAAVLSIGAIVPAPAQNQNPAPAAPVGQWSPAGELTVGRYAPAGLLLPDGRCLVAGGYSFEANRTHASCDLFDPGKPAGEQWSKGPELMLDRNFPVRAPISLPGGDVLLLAGFRLRGGSTASTERLDVASLKFRHGEPLITERELFSVCPLKDGRLLIAGGYSTRRQQTLDSAEIYDPKADRFSPTGSLVNGRFGHAAVLLPDGRVLIAGGKVLATNDDVLPAELFDPATGKFTVTGSLSAGRDRCTAWLLPAERVEGKERPVRVLVVGGSAKVGGTVPARRSEIYDPATGTFGPGPELLTDRMAHTMTELPGGRVLLVGGWSSSENRTTRQVELWDPATRSFLPAGTLQVGRHDHVAIRLKDGRVLVAGGKETPAREGVETPKLCELWSLK